MPSGRSTGVVRNRFKPEAEITGLYRVATIREHRRQSLPSAVERLVNTASGKEIGFWPVSETIRSQF
jgi:hypothetical protein